jgi:probable HAF family extracellular repeat protein
MTKVSFAMAAMVGLGLAQGLAQAAPNFQGVGFGVAWAVSGDGSTVVGWQPIPTLSSQAFMWTRSGGAVLLGDLPGGPTRGFAQAVSFDGSVIAGTGTIDNPRAPGNGLSGAFVWTKQTGMAAIGPFGIENNSEGRGISADGSVVAGWGDGGPRAYRWTQAGGTQVLLAPDGEQVFSNQAMGISADGSTVVGLQNHLVNGAGAIEAFRWTAAGGMQMLGDLPGGLYSSQAEKASADGSVVIGASIVEGLTSGSNVFQAFRWTEQTGMVGLGDLSGGDIRSAAHGISTDGSIIVGTGSSTLGDEPFIWDEAHGMRNLTTVLTQDYGLNLNGWVLYQALDISADGTVIVGNGYHNGVQEGWVAVVPEPSCALLVPLLLLARRRVRRG